MRACQKPEVVPYFELDKYMGAWFEQSRDKKCIYEFGECAIGNYTLQEDNTFHIRNDEYYTKLDMWKGADGIGTVVDPAKHEGYF